MIESVITDGGDAVLRLAAANVTMLLGEFEKDTNLDGVIDAADDEVHVVTVTDGQGFFVITEFGIGHE